MLNGICVRLSGIVQGSALTAFAAAIVLLAGSDQAFAQKAPKGGGGGIAVGTVIDPEVFPLRLTTVPDINVLRLLDQTGPNADLWPWDPITVPGNIIELQILGKALFWDMQVGGDGIQACATCHYHAGADHRKVNQMSPGLNAQMGPGLNAGDNEHDFIGTNATLTAGDFGFGDVATANRGLPVDEAALFDAGASADAPDGAPGTFAKADPLDVNDVVSSQGVRAGVHYGVSDNRVDTGELDVQDDAKGFTHAFSGNAAGVPDTVRRVEPRNAPTVLNAIYNHRSFHDGRGDSFFNGVNTLGFRDPDAEVRTAASGVLAWERLNLPFSSLASQAVGPIGSDFEMVLSGRPSRDLGKKLENAQPLRGQEVALNDSLLAADRDDSGPGLTGTYGERIRDIFNARFWDYGDGCVDANGDDIACFDGMMPNPESGYIGDGVVGAAETCYISETDLTMVECEVEAPNPDAYSLLAYNFPLFFGLAVQAYEATLFTEQTIVDLIGGGIATGTVTNGLAGKNLRSVDVGPPAISPAANGLPLEACIAALARNTKAAEQALATQRCAEHYAKFIHPDAHSGSESHLARFPTLVDGLPTAGVAIGGCTDLPDCTVPVERRQNGVNTILNIDRGLGRFFAGATGCGICHFNPEFNGATVQAITGFGAGPMGILPPGQIAREVEEPVVAERMITFNGLPTVYDAGFYNIGVRPTPEDIAIGGEIGGVPLAMTRLMEMIVLVNQGNTTEFGNLGYDAEKITAIHDSLAARTELMIPTSPTDLTPVPWELNVACGPGLNAPTANNTPNVQCVPTVVPGERLLRNGAFKAQGLRNVFFTGPYLHNGSKMNLRQVMEFYKTAGHFVNLSFHNLDAGMRIFDLGPQDEATVVELMEIGLTDWRVAFEEGKFDHPELCIPNGHDPATGETVLVGLRAIGATGTGGARLQTFEEHLFNDEAGEHNLLAPCTMPDIQVGGLSTIDVPPAPPNAAL